MSDPQISTANYAAVIADLEAKRDELDRTISMLKAMSVVGSRPPLNSPAPPAIVRQVPLPKLPADPHGGNTGIGETCSQILRAHDHEAPLSTRRVTDLLRECGFEFKTANPVNNVWSALDNRSKTKKDIRKDGKGWRFAGGGKGLPADANGHAAHR